MAAGDGFSPAQQAALQRAVSQAEALSGLGFAVYVGPLPEERASAEQRHATMPDPDRSVLVAVDPGGRRLEIVTGATAAMRCDARACGLATATMAASFGAGDLLGGIRNGLELLGSHARRATPLHTDTL